mmetsp:Transcript_241/g.602  ORF Transcript_241/g.602 Transcript_241/m.602 type:complete len:204 (-) Transcript_241:652-1263(-)
MRSFWNSPCTFLLSLLLACDLEGKALLSPGGPGDIVCKLRGGRPEVLPQHHEKRKERTQETMQTKSVSGTKERTKERKENCSLWPRTRSCMLSGDLLLFQQQPPRMIIERKTYWSTPIVSPVSSRTDLWDKCSKKRKNPQLFLATFFLSLPPCLSLVPHASNAHRPKVWPKKRLVAACGVSPPHHHQASLGGRKERQKMRFRW